MGGCCILSGDAHVLARRSADLERGVQAARFTGGLSHRPSYAAPTSPLAGVAKLVV